MIIDQALASANWCVMQGTTYLWKCYGPRARLLTIEKTDPEYYSDEVAHVIFDTDDGQVYELCVYSQPKVDEGHDSSAWAYAWINPDVREAYLEECEQRGVTPFEVWEDFTATEVDVEEDILEKLSDQVNMREIDHRVVVPLTLTDEEMFTLMKIAHERDVTLNELVGKVLTEEVLRIEREEK